MTITSKNIYGNLTDDSGRCVHYHTELDVIANKCAVCKKFYACYKCHDEMEDHKFSPLAADQKETVMCGVCGKLFSYSEYSQLSKCPECGSGFNPRCSLHKGIYSCRMNSNT